MNQGPFVFGQLVWHTPVTVSNLSCCHWIHFVQIFLTIPVILLSELRCAYKIFSLSLSLSPPFLFFFTNYKKERGEREKQRQKERNRSWTHIETPIMTSLDESNPTTARKVTNNDWSVPHESSEGKWALTHLDGLCGSHQLLFVTFIGVVRFDSLISFQ